MASESGRYRRMLRRRVLRVWCWLLGGHEWSYWKDDTRECRRGCGAIQFDGYWRKRWGKG